MASGRVFALSTNVCLVLCLSVFFNGCISQSTWNKTSFKDSDIYLASQLASGTKAQVFPVRKATRQNTVAKQSQTAYIQACITFKLLQRALLASALVALSGDVEVNPGFNCLADIKRNRGLTIAHLNIRSLRNKIDLIRLELLNETSLDVLTLSETWLDSSIQDSEVQLPGFSCVRRDRTSSKSGGGVIIYVRNGLPFRVREDLNNGDNECLWIELTRKICKPTLICCIYRAPDSDLTGFISKLFDCLPLMDLVDVSWFYWAILMWIFIKGCL